MTESTLFTLGFVLYIASVLFYMFFALSKSQGLAKVGSVLAIAGLLVHTIALILRTAESGHAPFTNMYESLSFLSWAMVLAFVIIDKKFHVPRIGLYIMLIVVGLVALASSPLMPKEATPLVPAARPSSASPSSRASCISRPRTRRRKNAWIP
jgi:ABC-type transport system involved in cytochrome c biogenesis permease subunit